MSLRSISANHRSDSTCLVRRPQPQGGNEMIDDREVTDFIEAERYELFAAPGYNFNLDRRDFIKTFGLGILFVVPTARALAQQRDQGESGRGRFGNNLPQEISAWIHIDEAGKVTVLTGKVEFGQNARTSLT